MNRDTLYSSAVLDLSEPATVIMPETGGRYQSLHVISQDHYSFAKTRPGRFELTQENISTRYAQLIVRTFCDSDDPDDIKATNALQEALDEVGIKTPFNTLDINILNVPGVKNEDARLDDDESR